MLTRLAVVRSAISSADRLAPSRKPVSFWHNSDSGTCSQKPLLIDLYCRYAANKGCPVLYTTVDNYVDSFGWEFFFVAMI